MCISTTFYNCTAITGHKGPYRPCKAFIGLVQPVSAHGPWGLVGPTGPVGLGPKASGRNIVATYFSIDIIANGNIIGGINNADNISGAIISLNNIGHNNTATIIGCNNNSHNICGYNIGAYNTCTNIGAYNTALKAHGPFSPKGWGPYRPCGPGAWGHFIGPSFIGTILSSDIVATYFSIDIIANGNTIGANICGTHISASNICTTSDTTSHTTISGTYYATIIGPTGHKGPYRPCIACTGPLGRRGRCFVLFCIDGNINCAGRINCNGSNCYAS